MFRKKQYSVEFVYEAHYIFMEVSNGIYSVAKCRTNMFRPGSYVSTDEVIKLLNSEHRVALCQNNVHTIIHANFEASRQRMTNAEMKGMLENA
jgi:hypothetical protein